MLKRLFRSFRNNTIEESPRRRGIASNNCISIIVHHGSGGIAIETEYYDYQNDCSSRNLYVVPEGQDVGQEINRILMIEQLKK